MAFALHYARKYFIKNFANRLSRVLEGYAGTLNERIIAPRTNRNKRQRYMRRINGARIRFTCDYVTSHALNDRHVMKIISDDVNFHLVGAPAYPVKSQ